ncbi:serine--tRNA ligase [Endomicrobiia bacterium]|nr:serine--tRNA ligase [Endomicrobiia bacterium]GHT14477.1 serine--tRNA ligase [Endomicrobiia bacterium]GHT19877.1 serine--tRNA ligase [Endomicrobiia bacterium]GHT26422.1 serine--tRNA ligase [Endomicrobiia bacterium]GHT30259.1 serine--tRNA ligase [Endomicrobiia bacterium]
MLDIKVIRENVKEVKQAMLNRNLDISFDQLLNWDSERKTIIGKIEQLRLKRNKESEEIGRLKKESKEPPAELLAEINKVRDIIQEQEKQLLTIEKHIEDFLLRIPNIPDKSVPVGKDEKDNKIIRFVGKPEKFSFKPKYHWEIGEKLGIIDFAAASKISGPHFAVLKNEGSALERAIISFFLDKHKEKGYKEITTPYLVNRASMTGTGQLPNLEEDSFKCAVDDLYLIPTAEVPVTNIYRDDVLEESALPQKYVSYSACFRRESGSYGKDTKGLIRNHQFDKVELVKFAKPETSSEELESLVLDAGNVLELLGLPYRVVLLSTGDIGFSSSKTYDLEVWFAGYGIYREISSCSNLKDFQARRMNIKVKYSQNKKRELLHTLNGSGVAVGRTFAAILENYQQEDGSVVIPNSLREYTGFDIIKP